MEVLPTSPSPAAAGVPSAAPAYRSRIGRWVLAATAALSALVLLVVAYGAWRGHAEDIATGQHDALNLARIIAAHAAQGIQAIDLNLATTEHVFRKMPTGLPATPAQIDWLLQGRLLLNPNVRTLYIIDRNGIGTHNTHDSGAFLGSDHAGRDYFRWHRDHPSAAVHISAPQLSRIRGTSFIPVSRRLTAPDGQFDGVIVAALEPKFFQDFYTSVDLGAHGSVAIFRRDGTLLARGPHIESLVGTSFASIPLFSTHLKTAEQGSYRQTAFTDGVDRTFGYATVPGTDLVVTAGFGEEDVLASWRHESATALGGAAIVVVALFLLTWILLRELRRRDTLTETLAREEARYRRLLSTANEGILKIDTQRRTVLVNAKACSLLGYTEEEIIGRDPFELVVEEDRPLGQKMIQMRQQEQVALQYELRFRRKDGSTLWTITSASSIFDEAGTYIGALAMLTDITERARAERNLLRNFKHVEALRALDQAILTAHSREEFAALGLARLRELFSYWGGAVMVFDFVKNDVEVLAVNRREDSAYDPGNHFTLEEYGARDLEVLRQGADLFVPRADPANLPSLLAKLYEQGMRSYVRIPLLAEGELIGALNLPCDSEGAYTNEQVVIARTVADQLAIGLRQSTLRGQVAQQAANLEKRVAERTAQLEMVNQELESFSYSVSHDLRAPVRHITGFAGMLLEENTALDEGAKGMIGRIQQAAARMNALIDDLLTLSKTSSQPLNRSWLDLGALVQEVIDELLLTVHHAPIDWRIERLASVCGDPTLVRAVLQNLIGNAVKYGAKREHLRIEVGMQAGASGEAVVFVRDNGAGFDMRHAEKLFKAFSRLHSAREFEGTGIGLATVQRIIHRHGGRIWAEAAVGEGATFYFTLPPE
jgi:PAS domain S-box-containing protein